MKAQGVWEADQLPGLGVSPGGLTLYKCKDALSLSS